MTQDKYIKSILGKPIFQYQKLHIKSKIVKLGKNVSSRFWPEEWRTIYYKGYARFPEVKLPKPELKKIYFDKVLSERQSGRIFSKSPLNAKKLSSLLYYSAGINPKHSFKERRFYPSGGGRFPLEMYVLSGNTELENGVYHYYVKNNSLERLTSFRREDINNITSLPWAKKAACLIIITAIFKRNTNKYGERGYRFILEEAGHMAQNFYLVASALDINICGIGAYIDDSVNKLIDIDGLEESVVYVLAAGEPREKVIDLQSSHIIE